MAPEISLKFGFEYVAEAVLRQAVDDGVVTQAQLEVYADKTLALDGVQDQITLTMKRRQGDGQ